MIRAACAAVAWLVCIAAFALYGVGLLRREAVRAAEHEQRQREAAPEAATKPRVESQSTTLARFEQ